MCGEIWLPINNVSHMKEKASAANKPDLALGPERKSYWKEISSFGCLPCQAELRAC